MRRFLKHSLLWSALLVWVAVSPWAFADSSVKLPNNVPPWLAQAKLVGPSNGSKQVAVAMYLQLSNVSGLESFIHDLYTPGTASYGHFLTPDEFRAAYSPSASALVAAQNFLSQGGLEGYLHAGEWDACGGHRPHGSGRKSIRGLPK